MASLSIGVEGGVSDLTCHVLFSGYICFSCGKSLTRIEKPQGWGDGSVNKSTPCCASVKTSVDPQHPLKSTYTHVPHIYTHLYIHISHIYTHTYTHTLYIHTCAYTHAIHTHPIYTHMYMHTYLICTHRKALGFTRHSGICL